MIYNNKSALIFLKYLLFRHFSQPKKLEVTSYINPNLKKSYSAQKIFIFEFLLIPLIMIDLKPVNSKKMKVICSFLVLVFVDIDSSQYP